MSRNCAAVAVISTQSALAFEGANHATDYVLSRLSHSRLGCVAGIRETDAYRLSVEGPGGSPFADVCTSSDVLVGFDFVSGSAINTITAACQSQNNGVLIREIYTLNTWGQPLDPTGPFGIGASPCCPPRQVISEMTVLLDKNQEVQNVQATCTNLLPQDKLQPTVIEAYSRGTAVTSKHIACSPGDVADGLIGRSGRLIDGLGIQCVTFHGPPPLPIAFVTVVKTAQIFPTCGGNSDAKKDGNNNEIDLQQNQSQVRLLQIGPAGNCTNWYKLTWPNAPADDNWVYSAPSSTPNDFHSLDDHSLAVAESVLPGH
jgi:hypothetical protein